MGQSEELLSKIRAELAKSGEVFNRFLSIVESLRDVLPDPAKLYDSAMKAMQKASGTDIKEVLKSADAQLADLKRVRETISRSTLERRKAAETTATKTREIQSHMAVLKEKLRQLEKEELDLKVKAEIEDREIKAAEEGLDSALKTVEKEITDTRAKVLFHLVGQQQPASGAAPKLLPQAPQPSLTTKAPQAPAGVSAIRGEVLEETTGFSKGAFLQDAMKLSDAKMAQEGVHPCPSCKSPMDWYDIGNRWKCYVCGHEEEGKKEK